MHADVAASSGKGVDRDLIVAVRAAFAEHADPERACAQQAYMKSALPFHGLTAPQCRRALKPVLAAYPQETRAGWEATVQAMYDEATHREQRYAALTLLGHRRYAAWRDPDLVPLLRHLVVTGAWWDLVDELASHRLGELHAAYPTEITPVIRTWAVQDDLWLRRAAILAQLHHRERTDTALLGQVLDANLAGSPHGESFWIRKAVGWALRQHARTDDEWVRAYVTGAGEQLSALSRREALKHL